MNRFDFHDRAFAISLAALAGYIDAIGFLATSGFFVSFMSGNTTRLGVGLGAGTSEAGVAARLIFLFVGGVALGTLIGAHAGKWRRCAILLVISGVIALGAAFGLAGRAGPAAMALAVGMGMVNTVLGGGEARIGLTYMTGTLVKIGEGIAGMISGHKTLEWLPNLLLWGGLMSGGWAGAAAYGNWGARCLWAGVFAALLLAAAGAAVVWARPQAGQR